MKFFDKDPLEETFMRLAENELYEVVTKEVMQEQVVAGIWGRAFSDVEGDMDKAKALYIKYRVQDLKDRAVMSQVQAEQARKEAERKRAEKAAADRVREAKLKEQERLRQGKEVIGTEKKARNILRNLGYKCNLKVSGEWVLNDEVELANNTELFGYLIGLKSELSDDFLIQRLRIAKRLSLLQIGENKFEVRSNSGNLTFNSPSELREYAIRVLFMEDE